MVDTIWKSTEGSSISSAWGIFFGVILSEGSSLSSAWGIVLGVILSEGSNISSVWGISLAIYCLRAVLYFQ